MSITAIQRAEQAFENLTAQINKDRIIPEEAEYLVIEASRIDREHEIDATVLRRVNESNIVSKSWGGENPKLHLTRFASTSIARLTETVVETRKNAQDHEILVYTGFRHDVAHAIFLQVLTYTLSERIWADYINTDAYQNTTHSKQNMARTASIRKWAHWMQEVVARVAGEEAQRRITDKELKEQFRVKRERLDAA